MVPETLTHAATITHALSGLLDALIEIIPKIVTVCAVLAAATAPDKTGPIRKVIDLFAFNFGHAKNANPND